MTTTFADEFGLPRTVDLFTSRARFLAAKTDWDKEHSFGGRYTEWNKKTAANLQEGLLVFHYAVLESTNVSGRNFRRSSSSSKQAARASRWAIGIAKVSAALNHSSVNQAAGFNEIRDGNPRCNAPIAFHHSGNYFWQSL